MEVSNLEAESSVRRVLSADRKVERERHTFDDILYTLMGDATPGNVLVLVFTITIFAAVPLAILLLFTKYSGGMRWVITLGAITVLGLAAVLLMRRGMSGIGRPQKRREAQTVFPGELTKLAETVERAMSGYVYSQQMLRERLCDEAVNKIGVARDLSRDEMDAMLDAGNAGFIDDKVLAKFVLEHRRGSKGWEDMQAHAKGKSAERGNRFMSEMEDILKRTEAIV